MDDVQAEELVSAAHALLSNGITLSRGGKRILLGEDAVVVKFADGGTESYSTVLEPLRILLDE